MSKHEKHAHAGARQQTKGQTEGADYDNLDELEGTEELLKTSFTAGNEIKIALAVILVLAVVLGAAVVKWMRHSADPTSQPAEESIAQSEDRGSSGASGKEGPDRREPSPFSATARSAKPTVVAAVPGPDIRPKSPVIERDTWPFASDTKPKPAKPLEESRSASAASFRPRMTPGDTGNRAGGSAVRNTSGSSFGGWENDTDASGSAASPRPADPFRSRPPVDGLRRDNSGLATAIPAAPGSPMSDTARNAPRSGDLTLPSAASRAPLGSA